MQANVQRWGNSLALRIPKSIASDLGIGTNSLVDLQVVQGHLEVLPSRTPSQELERLLAQVNEANLHHEVDTGEPVGNEVW